MSLGSKVMRNTPKMPLKVEIGVAFLMETLSVYTKLY